MRFAAVTRLQPSSRPMWNSTRWALIRGTPSDISTYINPSKTNGLRETGENGISLKGFLTVVSAVMVLTADSLLIEIVEGNGNIWTKGPCIGIPLVNIHVA
jgi:hypothetical protein